jgi:hypothetical protein
MEKPSQSRVLGKPDAGKPPVRFDEGRSGKNGTDNCGQFNPSRSASPTLLFVKKAETKMGLKRFFDKLM